MFTWCELEIQLTAGPILMMEVEEEPLLMKVMVGMGCSELNTIPWWAWWITILWVYIHCWAASVHQLAHNYASLQHLKMGAVGQRSYLWENPSVGRGKVPSRGNYECQLIEEMLCHATWPASGFLMFALSINATLEAYYQRLNSKWTLHTVTTISRST